MKLSKMVINNFRSLKKVEFCPGNFNIFVGQNNHGKTNIIEAIEWFYTGKGDLREIKYLNFRSWQKLVTYCNYK